MYSEEIKSLLQSRNYDISSSEYAHIVDTSPQISYMKWEGHIDKVRICTSDGYDFLTAMHPG